MQDFYWLALIFGADISQPEELYDLTLPQTH